MFVLLYVIGSNFLFVTHRQLQMNNADPSKNLFMSFIHLDLYPCVVCS